MVRWIIWAIVAIAFLAGFCGGLGTIWWIIGWVLKAGDHTDRPDGTD